MKTSNYSFPASHESMISAFYAVPEDQRTCWLTALLEQSATLAEDAIKAVVPDGSSFDSQIAPVDKATLNLSRVCTLIGLLFRLGVVDRELVKKAALRREEVVACAVHSCYYQVMSVFDFDPSLSAQQRRVVDCISQEAAAYGLGKSEDVQERILAVQEKITDCHVQLRGKTTLDDPDDFQAFRKLLLSRLELAKLHGFFSYAQYALSDGFVYCTPSAVYSLLSELESDGMLLMFSNLQGGCVLDSIPALQDKAVAFVSEKLNLQCRLSETLATDDVRQYLIYSGQRLKGRISLFRSSSDQVSTTYHLSTYARYASEEFVPDVAIVLDVTDDMSFLDLVRVLLHELGHAFFYVLAEQPYYDLNKYVSKDLKEFNSKFIEFLTADFLRETYGKRVNVVLKPIPEKRLAIAADFIRLYQTETEEQIDSLLAMFASGELSFHPQMVTSYAVNRHAYLLSERQAQLLYFTYRSLSSDADRQDFFRRYASLCRKGCMAQYEDFGL